MLDHLACGLLILAVATTSGFTTGDHKPPPFKITTKRADDRVEVEVEKDKAIFSVRSPFGISHAIIERAGETWPAAVVLQLHLKGLENFKVTNGKVKLEGSASLQDGKPLVRLWKDGKEEAPLDAKNPYWMEVRIVGGDGKQAKEIPLKGGYWKITVEWIDFYRG